MEHTKIKKECLVCPVNIWEYNGVKLKKTPEYNETHVKLNNGSKMKIGVCSQHISPKKKDYPVMTEKNRQGWLEELALGIGNKKWVMEHGSKLEVIGV